MKQSYVCNQCFDRISVTRVSYKCKCNVLSFHCSGMYDIRVGKIHTLGGGLDFPDTTFISLEGKLMHPHRKGYIITNFVPLPLGQDNETVLIEEFIKNIKMMAVYS